MPFQPTDYVQYLVPNEDTGPNEWRTTGVNHWTEIDESRLAPNTADYVNAINTSGPVERLGLTLPNKANLEGGFDHLRLGVYAWRGLLSTNIALRLNVCVKAAWQAPQFVVVTGAGVGNVAWYTADWSIFCCDMNDADNIEIEFYADTKSFGAPDSVFVATAYLRITGQDILPTADAKLSQFI